MAGALVLPSCGLCRTTKALPGAEREVPEGLLVNFHNHGPRGFPVVLLPEFNVFNRWQWRREPHHVRPLSWVESLVHLPLEGYYVLRRELLLEDGKSKWPRGTLVQLGYDRFASPIVFIAQQRQHLSDNFLWFSDRGLAIDDDSLGSLETLVVHEEPDAEHAPGRT